MNPPLARRLLAEYLGSAFLAAVVIGSGIAAQQLSPDDTGLALLETWRGAFAYIPAQVAGCISGAIAANGMFALAAISIATHHRASGAHLLGEVIATLGLLLVIFSLARSGRVASSTSFANPAISVGRMFSDTFAGIAPGSVPGFVVAQLLGGLLAVAVVRALYPSRCQHPEP